MIEQTGAVSQGKDEKFQGARARRDRQTFQMGQLWTPAGSEPGFTIRLPAGCNRNRSLRMQVLFRKAGACLASSVPCE